MIIERWKFGLGKIQLFNLKPEELKKVPPTIYLRNAKFRRTLAGEMMKGRRIKSLAIAASPHGNSEVKKLEKAIRLFLQSQFSRRKKPLIENVMQQCKSKPVHEKI